MNGWIKRFADGTEERGSDQDVARKLASWSRGRLKNLTSVELHHNGFVMCLEGMGEFWQSDDYDITIYQHDSDLITRRIQKKLDDLDNILMTNRVAGFHIYRVGYRNDPRWGEGNRRPIGTAQKGMWLTLEMNAKTGQVIFDFKPERI